MLAGREGAKLRTESTLGFIILLVAANYVQAQHVPLHFDGEKAYQHVLQQVNFGPRTPGSQAKELTAAYIKEAVAAAGFLVDCQNLTYQNSLLGTNAEGTNIIAKAQSAPNSTMMILGAHYDTRPFADRDDPSRRNEPVPGANDGASGVAILLELARVLTLERLNGTLVLLFIDAEDSGSSLNGWIQGSSYFVSHLSMEDRRKIRWVVILDMVGDASLQIYREIGSNTALTDLIWARASSLGYQQFIDQPRYQIIDDHTPFVEAGIPAVDIIDFDYPYWHTTSDTPDKVSPDSLEAVGRTIESFILDNPDFTSIPAAFPYTGLLIAAAVATLVVLVSYVGLKRTRRGKRQLDV